MNQESCFPWWSGQQSTQSYDLERVGASNINLIKTWKEKSLIRRSRVWYLFRYITVMWRSLSAFSNTWPFSVKQNTYTQALCTWTTSPLIAETRVGMFVTLHCCSVTRRHIIMFGFFFFFFLCKRRSYLWCLQIKRRWHFNSASIFVSLFARRSDARSDGNLVFKCCGETMQPLI